MRSEEEQARLEAVVKACVYNRLTTMELTLMEMMPVLEEADLDDVRQMVDRALEAVRDALAYMEDPEGFLEDNVPETEGEEWRCALARGAAW